MFLQSSSVLQGEAEMHLWQRKPCSSHCQQYELDKHSESTVLRQATYFPTCSPTNCDLRLNTYGTGSRNARLHNSRLPIINISWHFHYFITFLVILFTNRQINAGCHITTLTEVNIQMKLCYQMSHGALHFDNIVNILWKSPSGSWNIPTRNKVKKTHLSRRQWWAVTQTRDKLRKLKTYRKKVEWEGRISIHF